MAVDGCFVAIPGILAIHSLSSVDGRVTFTAPHSEGRELHDVVVTPQSHPNIVYRFVQFRNTESASEFIVYLSYP